MATIIKDSLVRGAGIYIGWTGMSLVREMVVDDIDFTNVGGSGAAGDARLLDALNATGDSAHGTQNARVPDVGEVHPVVGYLVCESVEVLPFLNSTSKARVICKYLDGKHVDVQYNGTLLRENGRFDIDGRLMVVSYTPPGGAERKQSIQADVYRPQGELSFSRVVVAGAGNNPEPHSGNWCNRLTGTLNSKPWQGSAERTWLCTAYRFHPAIGRTGYVNAWKESISFEWIGRTAGSRAGNWDIVGMYTDAHTGHPPIDAAQVTDAREGNGWRRFDVAPQFNFADLGLPEVIFRDK